MKKRNGFVSNSSSSSFVIFHKGDKKELRNDLNKALALPENYPIKGIDFASCFFECLNCDVIKSEEQYMMYRDDYGYDDADEKELALIKNGFTMYNGSFSTDDGGSNEFLAECTLQYESENLIIKGDGRC